MNTCQCASCCSSQAVYYRELQCCPCETVHYPRLPPIISPIRTRPVVYKSSIAPVTLPRSILIRETERNATTQKMRQNSSSQTKLKFGIDSILGKESSDVRQASTEEQFQHLESTTSKLQPEELQPKFAKHTKTMPPKRAVFSDYQRRQLEVEFLAHKYISKQERRILAKRLELSESQVRIWFQNRRMKWRNRQEREMMRRQRMNSLKQ